MDNVSLLRIALRLAQCFVATVCILSGQTSEITGRITDATGAVIAAASVAVTNTETRISRETLTNQEGYYSVPLLPPGNYEITIQTSGFSQINQTGVKLDVRQVARIDFTMKVGDVSEKIGVVGEAPLVATEEASLGTVIDARKIQELPLNGRNPLELITLAPGVGPNPRGPTASNINGGRDNASDLLIDGGAATSTEEGQALWSPPLEGVEEFKVETASFGAEFGRAGGVVNLVTKSGTNRVHGSLFEYFRNDALDANNFFFNATRIGKARLRYNQFGGSLGGPVWLPKVYDGHNRTFFFFAPQYNRRRGSALYQTLIPTELERAGDFTQSSLSGGPQAIFDPATTTRAGAGFVRDPFPGNVVPRSRFDPLAVRFIEEGYPVPNRPGGRVINFVSRGPAVDESDQFLARLDHNFTPANQLTFRYFETVGAVENPVPWPGRPVELSGASTAEIKSRLSQTVLRDTIILRPNLLNEFTYSLSYSSREFLPAGAFEGWAQRLGVKNAAPFHFPTVGLAGYNGLSGGNLAVDADVTHQFSDQATLVKGTHTAKAGFEFRSMYYANLQPPGSASGSFSFDALPSRNPAVTGAAAGGNSFASLLLGIPTSSSIRVGNDKLGRTYRYYAAFFQDKWKMSPKLTLSYGIRWEYTRPPSERWNRLSVFDLDTQTLRFVGENGVPRTLFEGDYTNFGPRVGLAYAPFGDNKTAIRASFGVYYAPIHGLASLGYTKGFTATQTWQTLDGGITFPLTLPDAFPVVPISRTVNPRDSVATIGPDYTNAMVNEWTLSIQHELFNRTLLDVGYVGTKGTHLQVRNHQLNQVPAQLLGPGNAQLRRPYPGLDAVTYNPEPIGNSTFHALQVKLERRLSSGLNLLGWYSL